MTVYFDGARLAGTSLKELHSVARHNGLDSGAFRDDPEQPHYVASPAVTPRILADNRIYLVSRKDLVGLTHRDAS